MAQQDIATLIVRIAMRDREAFDLLYRQTSARLFGVCLRMLNDPAEAEQTLQEVFCRIWEVAGRFAVSDLSPMAWLVGIARNHAIDRLRSKGRPSGDAAIADASVASAQDPVEMLEAGAASARMRRCLEKLDAERATALREAYLGGDSYAELAARHGVPPGTMRTWLRHSVLRLKECLDR